MANPIWLTRWLIRTGIARFLPAARRWADGGGAFLPYYSDRVLSAPLDDLARSAGLFEGVAPDAIDLAAGTPAFDLTPAGSTRQAADRRGCPPPWGLTELRALLADRHHAEFRQAFNPSDEVLIAHGGSGAFQAAADAFVNPGDRVVLFDPTSPLFALTLRHRRARLRWVPTWLEKGRTRFHLEPFARAMRGAKLLVLADPGNPTGGIFAAEDLEQIAWWAQRHDVLIYHDEAFARFQYEGDRARVGSFPGAQRRTLTAGSLSKGHGLAAARVGWLMGYRHLLRPCALVANLHAPFVPTVCQQIALAALRQGEEGFAALRAEFAARRRYGFDRLRKLGLEPAWPAGGFFFWVPVASLGMSGRELAEKLARGPRVCVVPGDCFGPSGVGHVRLSYAVDDGRFREGLNRLATWLADRRESARPERVGPGPMAEPERELASAAPAA